MEPSRMVVVSRPPLCNTIGDTIDAVVATSSSIAVVDSLAPTPPAVLTDERSIRMDRDRRIGSTVDDVIARVSCNTYQPQQQRVQQQSPYGQQQMPYQQQVAFSRSTYDELPENFLENISPNDGANTPMVYHTPTSSHTLTTLTTAVIPPSSSGGPVHDYMAAGSSSRPNNNYMIKIEHDHTMPPPMDHDKTLPAATELLPNGQRSIVRHALPPVSQHGNGGHHNGGMMQQQVYNSNHRNVHPSSQPKTVGGMSKVELASNLIATMFANPADQASTSHSTPPPTVNHGNNGTSSHHRQPSRSNGQSAHHHEYKIDPSTPAANMSVAERREASLRAQATLDAMDAECGNEDEIYIDTRELCHRVAYELKQCSIPQAIFADKILGRSQGTLSDLLRNPKPWNKLKSGRETFRRMYNWLKLPLEERLSILELYKDEQGQTQSNNGSQISNSLAKPAAKRRAPQTQHQQAQERLQQQQASVMSDDEDDHSRECSSLSPSSAHDKAMQLQAQRNHFDDIMSTVTVEAMRETGSISPTSYNKLHNDAKRQRLVFSDIQKRTLQAIFKETQRPSREMQNTIAEHLQLDLSTVANFFMNARRRSRTGAQLASNDEPAPNQQIRPITPPPLEQMKVKKPLKGRPPRTQSALHNFTPKAYRTLQMQQEQLEQQQMAQYDTLATSNMAANVKIEDTISDTVDDVVRNTAITEMSPPLPPPIPIPAGVKAKRMAAAQAAQDEYVSVDDTPSPTSLPPSSSVDMPSHSNTYVRRPTKRRAPVDPANDPELLNQVEID